MIRIGSGVEVFDMAGSTIRGGPRILSAHVTAQARHRCMHAAQRILGECRVIKVRICPSNGGVADGAICRPSVRHVIRVGDRLVLLEMATGTVGRQRGEVVAHMAARTRDAGMRAGERELRLAVVERGTQPVHRRMA